MLPRREHSALSLGLALAFALLCSGAAFGAGQPAIATVGQALVTQLAGHKVTIPLPHWIGGAQPSESPFVFNQIEPGVEALTFVPPGETVVTWTRLMGVLVVKKDGYDAKAAIASIMRPIGAACATGQLGVTPVKSLTAGQADALILACGHYKPTGVGPRGCAAGFLVAVVRESWLGAMKVYDEWCVGAFNLDDRSSWPVQPDELMRIVVQLQQATAFEPLS